ncbi:hypothetical protein Tco_1538062 [Tanacetum coccineum]
MMAVKVVESGMWGRGDSSKALPAECQPELSAPLLLVLLILHVPNPPIGVIPIESSTSSSPPSIYSQPDHPLSHHPRTPLILSVIRLSNKSGTRTRSSSPEKLGGCLGASGLLLKGNAASWQLSISNALVPLIEPLSIQNLVGEASTSGVPVIATTTALSTTFIQASTVPPVLVVDYEDSGIGPSTKVSSPSKIAFEKEELETKLEHTTATDDVPPSSSRRPPLRARMGSSPNCTLKPSNSFEWRKTIFKMVTSIRIRHVKAPNPSRLSKTWKSHKQPKTSLIPLKPDRAHICTISGAIRETCNN